jgi:hypothetical protein
MAQKGGMGAVSNNLLLFIIEIGKINRQFILSLQYLNNNYNEYLISTQILNISATILNLHLRAAFEFFRGSRTLTYHTHCC